MKKIKIGQFLKENKGKLIKGTLIVAGIVVVIVTVKVLKDRGANALLENLSPEEFADAAKDLVGLEG